MHCEDIAELLLVSELSPDIERHISECSRCTHTARAVGRLNAVLQSAVVTEPPAELQLQLAQLVATHAPDPKKQARWSRLFAGDLGLGRLDLGQLVLQPNVIAAQGLAAVMLALAGWQVFGWLSTFQPVVGDVGYAVQLVMASPASAYVSGLQVDVQSLGVWSVVGLIGWLVSDNGLIGRRLPRLRLP